MEANALLNKAICFAVERHTGQLRKGTTRPYITHPLETMTILSSMNADTNLLIAGVLHDILEDTDTIREEITERFGHDVASLVLSHTEDKTRSWEERKQTAVKELKSASIRAKALVMADKVSNLRSMYADHKQVGEQLWERFNAPKDKQAWYYREIQDALYEMQEFPEMQDIYREMVALYNALFVNNSIDT